MKMAYNDHCNDTVEDELISFHDWCEKHRQESPQFQYWYLILTMELTIFLLVRSYREADFALYCEALSELIPYFFANNNVKYAWWLPVHLRDMLSVEQHHPQLAKEFQMGNFVVHKSEREYSVMSIDQAHEQANAVIKGDGGAIGLTEDPSALRRWMVAGPEVSHLVSQYEAASKAKDVTEGTDRHEQREKTQRLFHEKVGRLTKTIQNMGNPFQEDSGDLLTLDTKDIAHTSAVALLGQHYGRGKEQFLKFMDALNPKMRICSTSQLKRTSLLSLNKGQQLVIPSKRH